MKRTKIDINNYSSRWLEEKGKKISFELVLSNLRKKQILKSLNRYKSKNILEIGCGFEPLFLYCHDYDSYTIIEPSSEFIQQAKKLAKKKANINIIHGYMEEKYKQLELKNYDFIILSSLLHEVPSPDNLLKSIYSVCNRDTVVHINVPNVYSFHRLLGYEMGLNKDIFEKSDAEIKFQRHTRFDKKSLFKILGKNNFQILSYWTNFIKPFSNDQMEKIVEKKLIDGDIVKGLERMTKYLPDLGCEMFVEAKIR